MTDTIAHLNACILAGGTGQRFWPLSRELKPKQLLSIFRTDSLIVDTVRRIRPFVDVGADGITIMCGERLAPELRDHLFAQDDESLSAVRFLVEPLARNTAPAIALAAADLMVRDPEGVMIVLPSDHVLDDDDAWTDVVHAAAALASDDWLVTIGITPSRPETGYGYIRTGASLSAYDYGSACPSESVGFVEKPDADTAEAYLAGGDYLWNAGIFVFKAEALLAGLEAVGEQGVGIARVAREIAEMPREKWCSREIKATFGALPRVPIDTALMEHSSRVAVIPADLGWSDVGSLLALEDVTPADETGNVVIGRGLEVDCNDTIVYARERCVAALGLQGMLVVDTEDATLVVPKDRAQDVRLVVEALKARGDAEVAEPKTALRPWGSWSVLQESIGFKIKRIEVTPGKRLSLQRHTKRSEHWVVVQGRALVMRDGETLEVGINESTFIPVGMVHRLENVGEDRLVIIEVQVGSYVGEDDIERLDDDWAR